MAFITLLVCLVVLVFMAGVFFVLSGYRKSSDETAGENTVSADLTKLQAEYSALKDNEQSLLSQIGDLGNELAASRAKVQEQEEAGRQAEELKARALEAGNKVRTMETQLEFLKGRADSQAGRAVEALSLLEQHLDNAAAGQARAREEDLAKLIALEKEKDLLGAQIGDYQARLSELETSLKTSGEMNAEQLRAANLAADRLGEENLTLRNGIARILSRVSEVDRMMAGYDEQVQGQIAEARQSEQEARKRFEELMAAREDTGAAVAELTGEVQQLKSERARLLQESDERQMELEQTIAAMKEKMASHPPEGESGQELKSALEQSRQDLMQARMTIEYLRSQPVAPSYSVPGDADGASEVRSLKEEAERLRTEIAELRENQILLEKKERILQDELTRSRVQAYGLEQILESSQQKSQIRKHNRKREPR